MPEMTASGVSPPIASEALPPRRSRRHGFEPAMGLHCLIVAIVERHAPHWRTSGNWRDANTLKKICTDLDRDEVAVPGRWVRGETQALGGARTTRWLEASEIATTGKKLVADQIRTSIEAVRKAQSLT